MSGMTTNYEQGGEWATVGERVCHTCNQTYKLSEIWTNQNSCSPCYPKRCILCNDSYRCTAEWRSPVFCKECSIQQVPREAWRNCKDCGGDFIMNGVDEVDESCLYCRQPRQGFEIFDVVALGLPDGWYMTDSDSDSPTFTGAPQAVIDRLPTTALVESMQDDLHKAECSICLCAVDLGTEVTILPCTHWYHEECIKVWLSDHASTCPYCSRDVTFEPLIDTTPTSAPEIATADNTNPGVDGAGEQEDQELGEAEDWEEECDGNV